MNVLSNLSLFSACSLSDARLQRNHEYAPRASGYEIIAVTDGHRRQATERQRKHAKRAGDIAELTADSGWRGATFGRNMGPDIAADGEQRCLQAKWRL
jgi:hypothetical protein